MRLAARSMSSLLSIFSTERISPSGMFGVMTVESGRSSSMSVCTASVFIRLEPLVATITGSTTMFFAP